MMQTNPGAWRQPSKEEAVSTFFHNFLRQLESFPSIRANLAELASKESYQPLRTALWNMPDLLKSGSTFANTLGAFDSLFDPTIVRIIKQGEDVDSLEVSLQRIIAILDFIPVTPDKSANRTTPTGKQFFNTLGNLLSCNVPISESLKLAGQREGGEFSNIAMKIEFVIGNGGRPSHVLNEHVEIFDPAAAEILDDYEDHLNLFRRLIKHAQE